MDAFGPSLSVNTAGLMMNPKGLYLKSKIKIASTNTETDRREQE